MTGRAKRLMELARELRLTPKQKAFAEALAGDPERNQTKAARLAGYESQPEVNGSKLVRLPKVTKYFDAICAAAEGARIERRVASAQEVLETMTAHMRGDLDDCLDEYGSFDLTKMRGRKKTQLLRELVITEKRLAGAEDGPELLERQTKVKLVDPQKAVDQLARHHGLYVGEADSRERSTLRDVARVLDAATIHRLAGALMMGPGPVGPVVDVEAVQDGGHSLP